MAEQDSVYVNPTGPGHRQYQRGLKDGYERGRQDGLEEAAKILERSGKNNWYRQYAFTLGEFADAIAYEIRELKSAKTDEEELTNADSTTQSTA